jgi:DNA invertase Pin-like site-specific DNA recombinase
MNTLTTDVKAGTIGEVIAPDLAMIARNFALMSDRRELLRAYGVKLVTLADGESTMG